MKKPNCFNRIFIITGLIILMFTVLSALDPEKKLTQYRLDIWQRERGLEQKNVISICQTKDGYLWLGTLGGLIRFDGIRFKTFKKANTKELTGEKIWKLIEDNDKNIWIGAEGGLTCLTGGEFNPFPLEDYPGLVGILSMTESGSGGIWIGTGKNGLLHLKGGEYTNYTTKDGLINNQVYALSEDKSGRLWVGTSGGLSVASEKFPGTFINYNGKNNILEKKHVLSILHSRTGVHWIGCNDGLYCVENNSVKSYFREIDHPQIMCLLEDNHGNIWVGTDGSGLMRIRAGVVDTFPQLHPLAGENIYALFEGNDKNLWIGSSDNGLYRLRNTLFTPYTTVEGLNHKDVNCIYNNGSDVFLLGTSQGVNRFESGQLTSLWTEKNGLKCNEVTAILKDDDQVVWIGTAKGIFRYREKKFKSVDVPGIKGEFIQDIKKDPTGTTWIIAGYYLWKYFRGKYTICEEVKGELRRIYIDVKNHPWVATYKKGLYICKNGKFVQVTTLDKLVSNLVECFYQDEEGTMYIGTRGGLSLLIEGKFFNVTTETGLLDSFVRHIIEDDYGHLWLTGRTGFSRIKKEELLEVARKEKKKVFPVLYHDAHGLKSPYCYDCTKTADGKLWFATDKGLAMVDPGNIPHFKFPIRTVIEEFIADGKTFNIGHRRRDLKNPIIISPGTRMFDFNYTGLRFADPLNITYKCKLEGYNDRWFDRGTIRNTSFNNLSPGCYTFKVKDSESEDKDAVSVTFELKPYFYETIWFYIGGIALALFSVFFSYRLRIRHLKKRQYELAAEVKLRTGEIEDKNRQLKHQSEKLKELDHMKSRFFANISHEFRTPLTLLLGPLEQLIDESNSGEIDKKRKFILMQRNAQRLLRLINQLMELAKMDSGRMKLEPVQTGIVTFLKGITDSFRIMVQQRELNLMFYSEFGDGDIDLLVDPRKMEDIMSNLLINALKFTPPGGEIRVNVKKIANSRERFPCGCVEISVLDTGPGIPSGQLPYVFDRFYQADTVYEHHHKGTGIGLALSKELVELHGGTISASNRENGGTRFVIELPLRTTVSSNQDTVVCRDDDPLDSDTYAILMSDDAEPSSAVCDLALQNNAAIEHLDCPALQLEEYVPGNIILLVEDSADMREYIKAALEPHFIVEEAVDGDDGIGKAKAIIPDLIISDIMMPGKDGYQLSRILKTDIETSHIPIILLTAKASEENIIEGLETGADDYITKPFSTKILSARVKNLIDLRSQLQQNFKREINLKPVKTTVSTIDREFLKDLQIVLKKNISDPDFNVGEMCKQLYMSNTTLCRKVQALCGLSPTEFIRSYRLKSAAELLKSGFGSVTEVAFEVGFSSRAYFTKCFKNMFNQLPSEVHGKR